MLLTSPTHKHLITPKILNDSLIQASMCNLPQLVRLLLQHGADPHYDNGAALSMSAKYGWSEVVEILLAHGADVDVDEGYPLMWACRNGHVEVVRLLFEQGGADAGSRDGTPLNVAAEYGHVPIVSYLLSSSHAAQQTAVNVHAQEDYPLRWASVRGHEPVVRLLLSKYGANVGAMNNFALRNSVKLRHYDVVRTLMEFGADPLAMDSEAIRVAVAGADDVLLQLLIRRPTNSSIPGSMENLSESLADSLTVAEE